MTTECVETNDICRPVDLCEELINFAIDLTAIGALIRVKSQRTMKTN